MTVVIPDGVDTRGNESVWWVPAIADVNAPKVTELSAGTPLQCAMYGFEPDASQKAAEDVRLCSRTKSEIPGIVDWTIKDLEYVYDPQAPEDSQEYKHYQVLVPNAKGFLVDRRGMAHEAEWAAGQVVDIYPVTLGARVRVKVDAGKDGEKFRTSQKPFIRTTPVLDVKTV